MSTRRSDAQAARHEESLDTPNDAAPFPGDVRSIAPSRPLERSDDREGEAAAVTAEAAVDLLSGRIDHLERQNRWLRYGLITVLIFAGYVGFERLFPEGVIVHKTMMESRELKLLDNQGQARLFLRMYSRVPVLQILDANGKPRMSLGLRFDDTPFIDLSDQRGNTRATFEMTEDDAPALRLFDEHGNTTFKIN